MSAYTEPLSDEPTPSAKHVVKQAAKPVAEPAAKPVARLLNRVVRGVNALLLAPHGGGKVRAQVLCRELFCLHQSCSSKSSGVVADVLRVQAARLKSRVLWGKHIDCAAATLMRCVNELNAPPSFEGFLELHAARLCPGLRAAYERYSARVEELLSAESTKRALSRFRYSAWQVMDQTYLSRDAKNVTRETPAQMFMRVALFLHAEESNVFWAKGRDAVWSECEALFNDLVNRRLSLATPILMNSGFADANLRSCFLLSYGSGDVPKEHEGGRSWEPTEWETRGNAEFRRGQSAETIDMLYMCSRISDKTGGIGVSVSRMRARGSPLREKNMADSPGVAGFASVLDKTSRFIASTARRSGGIALYIEPWHADIMEVLTLRRAKRGHPDFRAETLFYALWIPDLFMRRVAEGRAWSLFCPSVAGQLVDLWGAAFDAAYESLESDPATPRSEMPARQLWSEILDCQFETGMPYMLFKDACNARSNHNHLGTITNSNLCTEIVQWSGSKWASTACCNLGALVLPRLLHRPVRSGRAALNEPLFEQCARRLVRVLNLVIDSGEYMDPAMRQTNSRLRPLGAGVIGLADALHTCRLAFAEPDSCEYNRRVFEALSLYMHAEGVELARLSGQTYRPWAGSLLQRGILPPDTYPGAEKHLLYPEKWAALREPLREHGCYNSMFVAPMPTASTSTLMGYNECFEPYAENVFTKGTSSGPIECIAGGLRKELEEAGCWTHSVARGLLRHRGSFAEWMLCEGLWQVVVLDASKTTRDFLTQQLRAVLAGSSGQRSERVVRDLLSKLAVFVSLSAEQRARAELLFGLAHRYRTAFEIDQRLIVKMAHERMPFIDQNQSLNLFIDQNNHASDNDAARFASQLYFQAWAGGHCQWGLKSALYYLRTKTRTEPMDYTTVSVARTETVQKDTACAPDTPKAPASTKPEHLLAPAASPSFAASGLFNPADADTTPCEALAGSFLRETQSQMCLRGSGGPSCVACAL